MEGKGSKVKGGRERSLNGLFTLQFCYSPAAVYKEGRRHWERES